MYDFANQTFAGIPEGEIEPLDRMRLSFHLAREYHRRQDWESLGPQLENIELGKSWLGKRKLHPEVEYMRGEYAVQLGEFGKARQHFDLMEETNPLRAYGLFNLGVAYRSAGQLPQSQQTFQTLAVLPAYSDEAYDLGQRAKLALALIARQQKDVQSAENVLSALPGEGRYQEVAMAAYGGLAMDNQDYELAARIWMTLQEQDYWTPSTATARLGFPLSLEKLAGQQRTSTELALLQFQRAEASFVSRLDDLTRLSAEAQDPQWVQSLLQVFAEDEQDPEQMQVLMQKWQDQLGHTDWLEWLATDKINQALTQWRSLNEMEAWIGQLPEKLDALERVAAEQRRRGEQAQFMLVGEGLLAKRDLLQAKIVSAQKDLDALEAASPMPKPDWMVPLANDEERSLLNELGDMRKLLKHMSDSDHAKWSARIARLEGVLFYRLVDERAARLQELSKMHKDLVAVLDDVDARIKRVEGAESNFMAGVGTDFLVFQDRAADITALVNTARTGRENLLANEIRARMQQEMQQVQQYLLVTRIAIARATDQLALASTSGLTQ
jgi:tetratricopeptide (TPR) repeat protein